jgi:N-methylhydantoinase A/oxoprolinase/acetone carboxylase beta subunit
MGITVTTLTVSGVGARVPMTMPELAQGEAAPPAAALAGEHTVYFGGRAGQARFYSRGALLAGNRIPGPAVIDDEMTTIAVPDDAEATIDRYGNVHIQLETTE